MKTRLFLIATLILTVALAFSWGARPIAAEHVAPIFVADNPTCASVGLGTLLEYKLIKDGSDNPPDGVTTVYTFPDGVNTFTITVNAAGTHVDWTSTLAVDAVLVKGGPNANLYLYNPEETSDTGLRSPDHPNPGQIPAISHIIVCYDYELTVSKTADTSFTRKFTWTLDKSVDIDTWDMFNGDSGTSTYKIEVTKSDPIDSDWAVSGNITIQNNSPFSANITNVTDEISGFGAVTVVCDQGLPYDLPAGQTLNCSYSTALPNGDSRTNTATVTTTGSVGGGTATADVTFGDPTTVVDGDLDVTDTNPDVGPFNFTDDGSTTYTRTFTCDEDEGKHTNTASATLDDGSTLSDSVDVTVNCYALNVTKDATTAFTRTWDWTVEKTGDQSSLTLSPGQQFDVNYTVKVSATATDSDWAVTGSITVTNPAPMAATINDVSDLANGTTADVNCGVNFPYELAAGGTLNCTYSADLPNGEDGTNTATATLQNTPSGTTDFTGSAAITFGDPTTEIDECVDVTDDKANVLGTVCANEAPKTFNYTLTVGPYAVCGEFDYTNTATATTNDTGATASDDHNVDVTVPCATGCTLTPGYWKTHSKYGPAPFDDTWNLLGEDTIFFMSGQSYYQVLWTPPKGGNAYYILAHAYIAAQLNQLNGADFTAAQAAFDAATALFNTYTPDQIAAAKGKSGNELRDQFISLAGILDGYNNGLTGPGHCSE